MPSQSLVVTAASATIHTTRANGYCDPGDDPAQCAALSDFWSSTGGAGWFRQYGFLNGSSYCTWNDGGDLHGVFCDSPGSRNVISL